jgi:hypothetical protein
MILWSVLYLYSVFQAGHDHNKLLPATILALYSSIVVNLFIHPALQFFFFLTAVLLDYLKTVNGAGQTFVILLSFIVHCIEQSSSLAN